MSDNDVIEIAWIGLSDANPAAVRLTKKAVAEAAARRGAEPLPEEDWSLIEGIVCQTRLDSTIDAHFAAEGKVRGVEVVEVRWREPPRETARLRRVAAWLGAAMPLNPLAIAFIHEAGRVTDLRPAMAVPGRGVAVGGSASHHGAVAFLPAFWTPPAFDAPTALAWANAAFDALAIEERLAAIEAELATLDAQRTRGKTLAEQRTLFAKQAQLTDERQRLLKQKEALERMD